MKRYSKSQISAMSRMFSATVLKEMAKKGRSGLFRRLLEESPILDHVNTSSTVRNALDSAFKILMIPGNRSEYIYKSAIVQKILTGRHSLRTASMITEFRTGSCKADIIILNSTATVYEIKSERDSLSRLLHQIENYRKVFTKINIITNEEHMKEVLNTVPDNIGLLRLSNRYQITSVRTSKESLDAINSGAIFDSLRNDEQIAILQKMGIETPTLPNTKRHHELRRIFTTLDPYMAHKEMVRTLKQTRSLANQTNFIDHLPVSLQSAALSVTLRQSDQTRLIAAVNTPLHMAMTWR
ncbi:hypothetical protein EHV23_04680 [Lautropia dentalis]|uniref:Sce7726 family protein n=1 Tax=Lautropia dentalis TaxID=2490857 RepID=A0A3R8MSK0_9BURK|nr:hypothetical protein EHV23_04680 [Lautropia dentalis]